MKPLPLLASLALAIGSPPADADHRDVLFLGNSYTNSNQLPALVESLANAAGHTMLRAQNTPGGNTLGAPQGNGNEHVNNTTSLALIQSRPWDHVVLQEQSVIPSIDFPKNNWMFPAATTLDQVIKTGSPASNTTFFLTWGRKNGGQQCWSTHCSPAFADYFAMQDALDSA